MFSGGGSALSTFGFCSRLDETACSNPPVSFWMIVFRFGDCIIRAGSAKVKSPFPAASHSFILWFSLFSRLNRYRAAPLRAILCSFTKLKKAPDCQAENQHFKNKTKSLRPKVSKEVFGCCCHWQKQTIENESPLVGRWGKAPYPNNAYTFSLKYSV